MRVSDSREVPVLVADVPSEIFVRGLADSTVEVSLDPSCCVLRMFYNQVCLGSTSGSQSDSRFSQLDIAVIAVHDSHNLARARSRDASVCATISDDSLPQRSYAPCQQPSNSLRSSSQ